MKKHIISVFLILLLVTNAQAQATVYIKGANTGQSGLIVKNGAFLKINGSLTVDGTASPQAASDAYLQNNGIIHLKSNVQGGQSNLANNVSGLKTYTQGQTTGEVIFEADSSMQSIDGNGSVEFMNLNIKNTANPHLELNQNISIAGTLLLDGLIDIKDHDLSLLDSAVLTGEPFTSSNMIQADASGRFNRAIASGTGNYLFPIGDANANYTPLHLNLLSNTNSGKVGVNLKAMTHPEMNNPETALDYLSRYWNIHQEGLSTYSYKADFNFVNADINGMAQNIKLNRWENQWFEVNESDISMNVLAVTGILSENTAPLSGDFTGRNTKPTSIRDELGSGNVLVYPNPTSNQLFIQIPEEWVETLTLNLYNSIGQSIHQEIINRNNGNVVEIDMSMLSNGFYVMNLRNSKQDISLKVLKTK